MAIPLAAAVAGGILLIYGLVVFRFIARNSPLAASLVTFGLVLATALLAVLGSVSTGPVLYGAMIATILMSGVFGLAITALTTVIGLVVIGLVFANILTTDATYYETILLPLTVITGGIAWAVWGKHGRIKSSEEVMKPTSKKATNGSSIDAEVLISSISEGVVVVDEKSIIRVFNGAAGKITAWTTEEAFGLDHHSVLVLVDNKGAAITDEKNPFTMTFSKGEAVNFDKGKLQTKSQKLIELDLVTSPVFDANNKVVSVIGIFRDVSKERNEEKQRAEFISTASHEMRTPVAAIEGYLSLALNDKVAKIDTAARGYLEKAHVSTQHLGKLFQDLLTAAKSEDGRLTNHPEVVEVGQYLDEIIEGVRFTAEKKGLIMEADFAGSGAQQSTLTAGAPVVRPVAYVFVDQERIREVITNLFDNAVKYTETGKITIGMTTSDKEVQITVADTGPGIPKDDVSHLFQKFYRVDNTATRQVGGTGLGLFICRKIVELYNGKIWAESTVGKGSTFFVSLPRLSPEKAQELIKQQNVNASPLGRTITPPPATPIVQPTAAPAAASAPAPAQPSQTGSTGTG